MKEQVVVSVVEMREDEKGEGDTMAMGTDGDGRDGRDVMNHQGPAVRVGLGVVS